MTGVYNIPAGLPFLDCLAKGLITQNKQDPLALSQHLILLPTRKSCYNLTQAFLKQNNDKTLLLPKIRPLSDVDAEVHIPFFQEDFFTLPPVISNIKKHSLIMNLVLKYLNSQQNQYSDHYVTLAYQLTSDLIDLLNQANIEQLSWEKLEELVPSHLAEHWQLTVDFLKIITDHWPQILKTHGYIESTTKNHYFIESLIQHWTKNPPSYPVIVAGSTGTLSIVKNLLTLIPTFKKGQLIFAGLDTDLTQEETANLISTHPQYAHKRTLENLSLHPNDIGTWPYLPQDFISHPGLKRQELLKSAMGHIDKDNKINSSLSDALENLSYIPCKTIQEEAVVIALILRHHLEKPLITSALVTADLELSRRVAAELKRWNIDIKEPGEQLLKNTEPGTFILLIAEFASSWWQPVKFLALLKHPLMYFGHSKKFIQRLTRFLELKFFRNDRQLSTDFITIIQVVEPYPVIHQWLTKFKNLFEPFLTLLQQKDISLDIIIKCHIDLCHQLATDNNDHNFLALHTIWPEVDSFLSNILENIEGFPPLSGQNYGHFLTMLIEKETTTTSYENTHRISLLTPIEARLHHSDVVILGGLNEGSWPHESGADPWLNRPMKTKIGFASEGWSIGLSAHDFCQTFCLSQVYLTRSARVKGAPTTPSRWLLRIEALLKAYDKTLPCDERWQNWARLIDTSSDFEVVVPPAPCPPLNARPRQFSVTQIETLIRDPYSFYARHILKLKLLPNLNPSADLAKRGLLLHEIFDQYLREENTPFIPNALDRLLEIGRAKFSIYNHDKAIETFWWTQFLSIARWFINHEQTTRLPGTKSFTEVKGFLKLTTKHGPLKLMARADRIDVLPNGNLRIIDYKTGLSPSTQDIVLGFSPQLPLEAAIALYGNFDNIPRAPIESLEFWQLKGTKKESIIKYIKQDPRFLADQALEGLSKLITSYQLPGSTYLVNPHVSKGLRYNDYEHLARIREWRRG